MREPVVNLEQGLAENVLKAIPEERELVKIVEKALMNARAQNSHLELPLSQAKKLRAGIQRQIEGLSQVPGKEMELADAKACEAWLRVAITQAEEGNQRLEGGGVEKGGQDCEGWP